MKKLGWTKLNENFIDLFIQDHEGIFIYLYNVVVNFFICNCNKKKNYLCLYYSNFLG